MEISNIIFFSIGVVTGFIINYVSVLNYLMLIALGIIVERKFSAYNRFIVVLKSKSISYYYKKINELDAYKIDDKENQKCTQTAFNEMDISKIDLKNMRNEIANDIVKKSL